jgi:Phenazine biosynthesis-like protein
MQIPFVTVDVFTDRKFGGNPLAVVPDGRALTGAQMQVAAIESGLLRFTRNDEAAHFPAAAALALATISGGVA